MERNIECSTFFTRCWPAKMNEKKNSARLNEQLFNANGDRGKLESAGKNSRVFSQRCGTASYEEAGTSRSNFYMSTTSNYPPTSTVLLRFHWVSMRMRSKIECWPIILEEKIGISILSPFLFKNSNDFFQKYYYIILESKYFTYNFLFNTINVQENYRYLVEISILNEVCRNAEYPSNRIKNLFSWSTYWGSIRRIFGAHSWSASCLTTFWT